MTETKPPEGIQPPLSTQLTEEPPLQMPKSGDMTLSVIAMVIEAVIIAAMILIFRVLPISSQYLVPRIANGSIWAMILSVLYYFVAIMIAIWIYRYLIAPLLVKFFPKYAEWYLKQFDKFQKYAGKLKK